MKDRYLLFSGDLYYPHGGWKDFQGRHNSIQDAKKKFSEFDHDWADIVDIHSDKRVYKYVGGEWRNSGDVNK